MLKLFSYRLVNLWSFLAVVGLLAGAAYLQYFQNIIPCPLCLFQRLAFAVLGIVVLIGALFRLNTLGRIMISSLAFSVSLLGMITAGRQVWLQHVPPSPMETCGTSLSYMLDVLPVTDVIAKVFQGGSECSLVGWQIFGLSLAEWSMLCFIGFVVISVWQLLRK